MFLAKLTNNMLTIHLPEVGISYQKDTRTWYWI